MLFASNNLGKIKEVKDILKIDIKSLKDINQNIEVIEDQETFMENAIKKAKKIYELTGIPTIADDSGLEIDALNGFPGVLTHRFLGKNSSDSDRNQEILKLLQNKENRTCYFTCCIAFYDGINLITHEYRLKGEISKYEHINNGFGFDSIFLYNNKFLSDMSLDEKNQVSPRKIALTNLAKDKIFQKNLDLMK